MRTPATVIGTRPLPSRGPGFPIVLLRLRGGPTRMSYYCYSTGTYNQYPSHHGPQYVQCCSSSANVEHGEFSFSTAPIDFLNWDDSFLTPSTGSVTSVTQVLKYSSTQASATLPIQTSLLPHSCLDIVTSSSRTLSVAAPVPVPHAAQTKAALRTTMSFDDKGSIYSIHLTKKLN